MKTKIIIFSFGICLIGFFLYFSLNKNKNTEIKFSTQVLEYAKEYSFINYLTDLYDSVLKTDKETEIVLKFTGDVILARSVNFLTVKNNDFTWAFKNIAEELRNADITAINLESPLIKNCPLTNEGFKFCGDERHIQGLLFSGIDIAGFSNNHMGNYGTEGVENTENLLLKNNILISGTKKNRIAYIEVKGTKFAFLSLNSIGYPEESLIWLNEDTLKSQISEARKNSDIVIVQIHWGDEYTSKPNEFQKKYGRMSIDLGADLVVGNHPHQIGEVEIYKDKYILYALGNFIFDQEWSRETKEGLIAKVTVKNKKISMIEFIPIEIKNYGQVFKRNK